MRTFTLHHGPQIRVRNNTEYPTTVAVSSVEDFARATKFDHICTSLKDNSRASGWMFESADCFMTDVDNSHSENAEDWVTRDEFEAEFKDYEHISIASYSDGISKGGKAARPKFHIYFAIDSIDTVDGFTAELMKLLVSYRKNGHLIFDQSCKDAGRHFGGHYAPDSIRYNSGKLITESFQTNESAFERMRSAEAPTMETESETVRLLKKRGWTYTKIMKHIKPEDVYGKDLRDVKSKNGGWMIKCGLPGHNDNNPSMWVWEDKLNYDCKSRCGSGGAFEYMAKKNERSLDEVVNMICDFVELRGGDSADEMTPVELAVDQMNEKYAMITGEVQASVLMQGEKGLIRKPWNSVTTTERYKTMIASEEDGKEKTVFNHTLWQNAMDDRREYSTLTFDPTQTEPPERSDAWNMWFDFNDPTVFGFRQNINRDIYDTYTKESAEKACDKYVALIKDIICGGSEDQAENAKMYTYIRYWLTSAITQPARKPMTAIVLSSGQGQGKGTFVENFLKLYGDHGTKVESAQELTNNFNWRFRHNLLTMIDEALFAGDHRNKNLMKNLISSKTRSLEGKNVDTITVPNYSRYIYASNEDFVVSIDDDDRRHVILELSDAQKQNDEYFIAVEEQWDSGGMEAFLWLIENVWCHEAAFKAFKFEKEIIRNTAKINQEKESNLLWGWWESRKEIGFFTSSVGGDYKRIHLENGKINEFVGLDTEHIFMDYEDWQKGRRGDPMLKNRFSRELMKLNTGFVSHGQKRIEGAMTAIWTIDLT